MQTDGASVGYQRLFPILFEITKQLNSGVELSRLMRYVATEIVGLTKADSCSIILLDDDQNELLCKATNGLSREEEDTLTFRMGEGITGWVVSHGVPALIPNAAKDKRLTDSEKRMPKVVSLLCTPLMYKGAAIGTITIASDVPEAFDRTDEEALQFLGSSAVQDIQNARLFRLSVTDPLTKVCNRQHLYLKLPEEIERGRRYGFDLSMLVVNVDQFGKFNEKHGRSCGDHVLKDLAHLISGEVREVDSVARIGGSQFVILLPHTDAGDAMRIGKRLRQAIESMEIPSDKGRVKVTVSIGCAKYAGAADSEGFMRQADEALFKAKARGGNRVEKYQQFTETPIEST